MDGSEEAPKRARTNPLLGVGLTLTKSSVYLGGLASARAPQVAEVDESARAEVLGPGTTAQALKKTFKICGGGHYAAVAALKCSHRATCAQGCGAPVKQGAKYKPGPCPARAGRGTVAASGASLYTHHRQGGRSSAAERANIVPRAVQLATTAAFATFRSGDESEVGADARDTTVNAMLVACAQNGYQCTIVGTFMGGEGIHQRDSFAQTARGPPGWGCMCPSLLLGGRDVCGPQCMTTAAFAIHELHGGKSSSALGGGAPSPFQRRGPVPAAPSAPPQGMPLPAPVQALPRLVDHCSASSRAINLLGQLCISGTELDPVEAGTVDVRAARRAVLALSYP
ncbi:hypothetical protein T492DRAFT_1138823 [Pavlovales sp. CCMP2436]|nr:hypothetical protein T492DRAFT_1138823 [Pavlovales sp. CCMP2436]|mmetsp:Transcript_10306/g.24717  ORF Transcript_10306/g.24717 Transcript_10306/m.24717 type:complete len:340 (+) Transcript_10306:139-1158(+)